MWLRQESLFPLCYQAGPNSRFSPFLHFNGRQLFTRRRQCNGETGERNVVFFQMGENALAYLMMPAAWTLGYLQSEVKTVQPSSLKILCNAMKVLCKVM